MEPTGMNGANAAHAVDANQIALIVDLSIATVETTRSGARGRMLDGQYKTTEADKNGDFYILEFQLFRVNVKVKTAKGAKWEAQLEKWAAQAEVDKKNRKAAKEAATKPGPVTSRFVTPEAPAVSNLFDELQQLSKPELQALITTMRAKRGKKK